MEGWQIFSDEKCERIKCYFEQETIMRELRQLLQRKRNMYKEKKLVQQNKEILMEYPREKFPLLYKRLSTTLELLRGKVKFSYTEDGILAEKYINGYHVKAMIKEECDLECMLEVWEQNAYECYFPEETVVVDLGMNIGLASLFFATMDNVSYIYSYELFEPTYQRALMNIRLNPVLSDKIKAFNYGVGKENKKIMCEYAADFSWGCGTWNIEENGLYHKATEKKECLVKSISELMRDIKNDINLNVMKLGIKMDIEGSEYEVFETLHKSDEFKNISWITMEYHMGKEHLLSILKEYSFFIITNKGCMNSLGEQGTIWAVRQWGRT